MWPAHYQKQYSGFSIKSLYHQKFYLPRTTQQGEEPYQKWKHSSDLIFFTFVSIELLWNIFEMKNHKK